MKHKRKPGRPSGSGKPERKCYYCRAYKLRNQFYGESSVCIPCNSDYGLLRSYIRLAKQKGASAIYARMAAYEARIRLLHRASAMADVPLPDVPPSHLHCKTCGDGPAAGLSVRQAWHWLIDHLENHIERNAIKVIWP